MPGFIVQADATILCFHTGQATPTTVFPRVRLSGKPVVTQTTVYAIAGCILPPVSGGPCVTGQWVTGATRVRAGGMPVLLMDSQAVCVPTGTGLQVIVTQLRVKGT